ncbi:hypothetical protein F6U93_09725 [Tamlana haliotis]|uniref:Outer membrane protein beta-barrel domain-containing protein n=1 Tax=Pseudotamlana haliotis TaxID=2614804 RepID=A0A6N6MBC9_9FLAO|nr:hypothetical protein [Tamlana haliotis]KAB1067872.1 hypothetical protein F6U93_09725 [Tamlana haliotis]
MKTTKFYLLLSLLWINLITAQEQSESIIVEAPSDRFTNNWSFSAGVNMVDDSGNSLNTLFDFKENRKHNWAFKNPIYLGATYYYKAQFSFYARTSFNSFKPGKSIDGTVVDEQSNPGFFAFDLGTLYSFKKLMNSEIFDLYIGYGFGYTNIGDYINQKDQQEIDPKGRITGNASGGLNIWLTKNIALNMEAIAKLAYTTDTSHYLQYNLGVVYLLSKTPL